MSVPGGSPLGRILADWSMYCYYPMSKEVLTYYCNTVWPTYVLDCGERWPMRGSLSYCTITQLEQCCQQLDRWDEIRYVNVFVLYNRVLPGTENCLMVQRREEASKPFLDSKTQEERENKEINLINILNPGE